MPKAACPKCSHILEYTADEIGIVLTCADCGAEMIAPAVRSARHLPDTPSFRVPRDYRFLKIAVRVVAVLVGAALGLKILSATAASSSPDAPESLALALFIGAILGMAVFVAVVTLSEIAVAILSACETLFRIEDEIARRR